MKKNLLTKYFENETSESETREVLNWIDANPENQRYFNELRSAYVVAKLHKPARAVARVIPMRRNILRWSASAAAVLFICVGAGFWVANRTIDIRSSRMTTITASNGQCIDMTLQDGSRVWLNSGATLEFPAIFSNKERRVKIEGEVLFNVRKDQAPFIVETFVTDVKVTGTEFNVVSYRDAGRFSVGLIEGMVNVGGIEMKQGEVVRLVDGSLWRGGKVNADDLLWVDGIISIAGLTFEEVMAKFEQHYNVTIDIARSDIPKIDVQRGKIRISDGVEHALEMLQRQTDFKYENDTISGTITIK